MYESPMPVFYVDDIPWRDIRNRDCKSHASTPMNSVQYHGESQHPMLGATSVKSLFLCVGTEGRTLIKE